MKTSPRVEQNKRKIEAINESLKFQGINLKSCKSIEFHKTKKINYTFFRHACDELRSLGFKIDDVVKEKCCKVAIDRMDIDLCGKEKYNILEIVEMYLSYGLYIHDKPVIDDDYSLDKGERLETLERRERLLTHGKKMFVYLMENELLKPEDTVVFEINDYMPDESNYRNDKEYLKELSITKGRDGVSEWRFLEKIFDDERDEYIMLFQNKLTGENIHELYYSTYSTIKSITRPIIKELIIID